MKQSHILCLTIVAFFVSIIVGVGIDANRDDMPPTWVGFVSFLMLPIVYVYSRCAKSIIDNTHENSEGFSVHPFRRPDKYNELCGYVGIASGIGVSIGTLLTGQGIAFEGIAFFGAGVSFLLGTRMAMRKK
jgi:hypothetical protein